MSSAPPSPNNSFPLWRLFPNVVTLIGLCFGLFAIKYAMVGRWEVSVLLIVVAAFIDGLDGSIARLLKASSTFGAQLDSLTDFVNFGVAPALILYMWKTHEIKGIGWAVALFFIICQALRLARFNANLEKTEQEDKSLSKKFFLGVPAPVGAGLSILPMIVSFFFNEKFGTKSFDISASVVIVHMAIIALLMVSRIATLSAKSISVKREYTSIILAMVGLFITVMIIEPWITLTIMGIGYLATIPVSVYFYMRMSNR